MFNINFIKKLRFFVETINKNSGFRYDKTKGNEIDKFKNACDDNKKAL